MSREFMEHGPFKVPKDFDRAQKLHPVNDRSLQHAYFIEVILETRFGIALLTIGEQINLRFLPLRFGRQSRILG
jgi:hypothetical protein